MSDRYPICSIRWEPAFRVIPTRYPTVNLFDRVASAEHFGALYALEAMTNDRVRDEMGQIELVPPGERLFGPGSGPIMAAFTHLNPQGSRFSDGSFGVFYCGREEVTAIAETVYHSERFMRATNEGPMRLQMRLYTVSCRGKVVDLRKELYPKSRIFDPSGYIHSQPVGKTIRDEGKNGIVYRSVRYLKGQCVAAFRTTLLSKCVHNAYLEYNWNEKKIDAAYKLSQVFGR